MHKFEVNYLNPQKLIDFNSNCLIFDSSSLIYIYKADLINILYNNFKVYISNYIYNEINSGKDDLILQIREKTNIYDIDEIDILKYFENLNYIKKKKLTKADLSTLVLFEKLKYPIVTEDKNIINILFYRNESFLNSLSFIFILYKIGILEKKNAIFKLFEINKYGYYNENIFSEIYNFLLKYKKE